MGVGAGLYMCDVVVKSSRSLSHLLMSSCCKKPQTRWKAHVLHTLRLVARQPWRHSVTSLRSTHWFASSLKLAARCPVSGCWPSCTNANGRPKVLQQIALTFTLRYVFNRANCVALRMLSCLKFVGEVLSVLFMKLSKWWTICLRLFVFSNSELFLRN